MSPSIRVCLARISACSARISACSARISACSVRISAWPAFRSDTSVSRRSTRPGSSISPSTLAGSFISSSTLAGSSISSSTLAGSSISSSTLAGNSISLSTLAGSVRNSSVSRALSRSVLASGLSFNSAASLSARRPGFRGWATMRNISLKPLVHNITNRRAAAFGFGLGGVPFLLAAALSGEARL